MENVYSSETRGDGYQLGDGVVQGSNISQRSYKSFEISKIQITENFINSP